VAVVQLFDPLLPDSARASSSFQLTLLKESPSPGESGGDRALAAFTQG
jgi:hypothetical protein